MVQINPHIKIDENELELIFIRANGPGGQNVNKVATAVQLRYDVLQSTSLPEEVKSRLIKMAGKRMTQDGVLVIEARRFRTQEKNREDAFARFSALVQKALEAPPSRKMTKPTQAAHEARLKVKKHRSEIKKSRSRQSFEQE